MGLFKITYTTLNKDETESVLVQADSLVEAVKKTDKHTQEKTTSGQNPLPITKVEVLKEDLL